MAEGFHAGIVHHGWIMGRATQIEGTCLGDNRRPALQSDARRANRGHHAGHGSTLHLDVLQAAIVALAAALRPDQGNVARAALLVDVADLEDRPGNAAEDAAAAGALCAVLAALVRNPTPFLDGGTDGGTARKAPDNPHEC